MQQGSEDYRHKAAECARKALACGEPTIRHGYAEAARRWRHLAEKKEACAYGSLPINRERSADAAFCTVLSSDR